MEPMQIIYDFGSSLSVLQRGLSKLREIRVVFDSFEEMSKQVLIHILKKIDLKVHFS